MKRIEAWHTLHEMWDSATPEQKEALGVAMDDIEFVDLIRGHGVPLTNAQHIRSMTDEELAKFLLEIMSNSVCFGEGMFPYHPCPQEQDCEKCGLGWLKKPYEEAE